MKTNKKSVIVLFCIAAAMFLGGVLAIFVPKLIPSKSPVAISQEIRMVRIDYGEYSLTGKIKNVSDKEIVISGHGGLTVSFTDSNDVFDDYWFGEESRDIVLLPNEEFDLSNTAYCFEEQTSVKKVVVNVDGETYTLKGGANLPLVFTVVFLIFGAVFLVLALCQIPKMKAAGVRTEAVNAMCAQLGGLCVLNGVVSNKAEEKKAVAKSVAWGIGAIFSTIFLGAGVYKIYGGAPRREFILCENALYILDPAKNEVSYNTIMKATRNEFYASSITSKKNSVTMKGADGVTYFTFVLKGCPITAEQLIEKLTNIFVNGPIMNEDEVAASDTAKEIEVFEEFAQPAPATEADGVNADENSDGEKE